MSLEQAMSNEEFQVSEAAASNGKRKYERAEKNEEDLKNLLESFGKSVELRRKAAGLLQKDLADVFDMHPSAIANVEKGKGGLSLYRACVIAATLGMNMDSHVMCIQAKAEKERFAAKIQEAHGDIDSKIKETRRPAEEPEAAEAHLGQAWAGVTGKTKAPGIA